MAGISERVYVDKDGLTKKQYVDAEGTVLDELILEERWRRENERVFVYGEKEEDFGEESGLGRKPEHIKLYRTNMQHILAKEGLTKDARCAFLSCLAYIDWNSNFVVDPSTHKPLSGRELAEKTGLSKDAVNRGLKELQEKGIIAVMSSGKSGRANHYVVNTSLAWKGKRVAKEIAQVRHFEDNGLKLPVTIKYSQGIRNK